MGRIKAWGPELLAVAVLTFPWLPAHHDRHHHHHTRSRRRPGALPERKSRLPGLVTRRCPRRAMGPRAAGFLPGAPPVFFQTRYRQTQGCCTQQL
jgi:hypothetical protein